MTGIRAVHRTLAIAGAALAILAATVGTPIPSERGTLLGARIGIDSASSTPRILEARQLAAWIRDGDVPVRVLDLRGDSAYASHHIPSAEPADFARLDTLARQRDETLVLYSDDDVHDTQAWANLAARGHDRTYVLSRGMQAWMEEVMEPVLHGDSADYLAALSRYFGGAPRLADHRAPAPTPEVRAGDERPSTDAFGEAVRRGC